MSDDSCGMDNNWDSGGVLVSTDGGETPFLVLASANRCDETKSSFLLARQGDGSILSGP